MDEKYIFLLEDNKDMIDCFSLCLADYKHFIVSTKEEVDNILKGRCPPSIVIFSHYRDSDLELILYIKSKCSKSNVLLLTAVTNTDDLIEKLKPDYVLKKPFHLKEFYDVINKLQ